MNPPDPLKQHTTGVADTGSFRRLAEGVSAFAVAAAKRDPLPEEAIR